MIEWEEKIVIVHPPRCGGSSIEEALCPNFFADHPWEKHRSAKELFEIIAWRRQNPNSFAWYGLKRHPIERLKSMMGREYWNASVAFPMQGITGLKGPFFEMQFASLVKPAKHEGKNLRLVDFFDLDKQTTDELKIEIFDITQLDLLASKLGIHKLPHFQKTPQKIGTTTFMFDCVIYARFRDDFRSMNYPVKRSWRVMIPFTMLIIAAYNILHFVLWKIRDSISPNHRYR